MTTNILSSGNHMSRDMFLKGPAGRLECRLDLPRQQNPVAMAVVCHPHPLYAGTMHNKVAYTLAHAAIDSGAVAVRFNFRGVGKSEGAFGRGRGEQEDLAIVEAWLGSNYSGLSLWRLGFSFGAAMVFMRSLSAPCDQLVTVAPPVERMSEYGLDGDWEPKCRHWILIQGDADEVVSPAATYAWARRRSIPPDLVSFADTGHFFHGRLTDLRRAVVKGLPESMA